MSSSGGTVLIVEDELGLAELFEIWLGRGFDVYTATSGRSALEALDHDFDVVVLDWRMPEVSGAEILERIRGRALDCRVAVVTGLDPEIVDIEESVDAVLRKPVDADELLGVVGGLADQSDGFE